MNEKVNNFSLAGDKFMPEMCLIHPGITYSACVLFTKNKERVQKSTEIKSFKIYLSQWTRWSLVSP